MTVLLATVIAIIALALAVALAGKLPIPALRAASFRKLAIAVAVGLAAVAAVSMGQAQSADREGDRVLDSAERATYTEPVSEVTDPDTLVGAAELVDEGDYDWAAAIASSLTPDEEQRILRKISRHLALRIRKAVKRGRYETARDLLKQAKAYPNTPEIRAARARVP